MQRSTQAITLVLMGSALALVGCARQTEQDEENSSYGGGVGGIHTVGRVGGGGSPTGGVSNTASARGGFGATGISAVS